MTTTFEEFAKLTQAVWGAYEYLRDNDLSVESGTSKRLRAGNPGKLFDRLLEELDELRGVVEGTHIHEGFESDLILEGYEVWYWGACLAIANGMDYILVQPHAAFLYGFEQSRVERKDLLPEFDRLITTLKTEDPTNVIRSRFEAVFRLIGRACRLNNIHPARLLERDYTEMQSKAYLAPYWQSL